MTNVSELVATVLYQDVQIAQNLAFSELSMEKAVLDLAEPLPVATELSVRIDHPEGQVLGQAVVTRVREGRGAGETGCMHVRWVEFADADFARLAGWMSAPDAAPPVKPAPQPAKAVPAPEPAPEAVASEEPAPEIVAEAVPEASVSVPEAVAEEGERTIPIDAGATVLDLAAVTDGQPAEDTSAHEGTEGNGEEISVVEEEGSTSGDEEGGDKKKRRRRTKKK